MRGKERGRKGRRGETDELTLSCRDQKRRSFPFLCRTYRSPSTFRSIRKGTPFILVRAALADVALAQT